MFLLFRRACLLYKTSKTLFNDLLSRFMTWEYRGFHGVTTGYRGLQGVTSGYKGLQEVTRGYKGLQRVTRDDRGLQGVTKNQRNFFLTRTIADTFSWSILHENQS